MGEDYRAWHRQLNLNMQSPYLNYSSCGGAPAHVDYGLSSYLKPSSNTAPVNGTLFPSSFRVSEAPPDLLGRQASEPPRGWFYCLPRFRQAFGPTPGTSLPSVPNEQRLPETPPKPNADRAQKKFLVVDQSGDQTTLIFSSGAGDPVRCLASWKRNPKAGDLSTDEEDAVAGAERATKNLSGPVFTDAFDENDGTGTESEMHEDTEELDALLYSDDDGDNDDAGDSVEDNEVTSTGHSPSTMTSFDKQEEEEEWCDTDEAASSTGIAKKRKLELEDDAESSSCGGLSSLQGGNNKKVRKEKIRETVSVLQTIIPDGEGKDAVVVLDEAIRYLKSLKQTAQDFGFDAL